MPNDASTCSPDVVRSDLAGIRAVAQVLPGYVAGLSRDVARLAPPLDPARRAELRRIAHQLRGSGGAYGFGEITRLATVVESAFDDGKPLDQVEADVRALLDLIRRVEGYDRAAEAAHARSMAA